MEKTRKNLVQSLKSSGEDVVGTFDVWVGEISGFLFNGIFKLINGKYEFEPNEVKIIIDYIILTRYDNETTFKNIFNILLSMKKSLPFETFEIGMYILERHGKFLSSPKLHSNYSYSKDKDIQKELQECPICGVEGEPYFTAFSFVMVNFENPHLPFKLWMKCNGCGNCYSRYFDVEYFNMGIEYKKILPNETKVFLQEPISSVLYIWAEILNKIYKINNNKELLEIGVGKGDLIAVALELGYNVEVVEIVEESAQEISNVLQIPIHNCDFLKFETNKKYSVIIMGDVIEHVTDPRKALLKVHELLDDDGVLWLSTPNFESSFSRLQQENYIMWCEPHHLTFFSKEGLELLLDECGFKVIEYNISQKYKGSMELFIQKK